MRTRSGAAPARPHIFALRSGRELGVRVAAQLGVALAQHEEREFEWGQHNTRPLLNVRGRDAYVVQSLHGDPEQSVNDKLSRLLFFLGTLRDASARSVTAVVPLLCYSRKERRTQPRDPVLTRYVARLFETVAVDRFVTLEVHDLASFQNAFRCRTEHPTAHALFAASLADELDDQDVVVASLDVGGAKRADRYRAARGRRLGRDLPGAFVEKRRERDVVSGGAVVGEVDGRTVVLVDDRMCGGTTLARAAESFHRAGARRVLALAAHGPDRSPAGAGRRPSRRSRARSSLPARLGRSKKPRSGAGSAQGTVARLPIDDLSSANLLHSACRARPRLRLAAVDRTGAPRTGPPGVCSSRG